MYTTCGVSTCVTVVRGRRLNTCFMNADWLIQVLATGLLYAASHRYDVLLVELHALRIPLQRHQAEPAIQALMASEELQECFRNNFSYRTGFLQTGKTGGISQLLMMAAGLDFKLTGAALSTGLPSAPAPTQRIKGLIPEMGGFEALSRPAGKVWSAQICASVEHDAISPKVLQEALWKQFFEDRTQWWDYRWSKPTPRHPDFKHKEGNVALWLNNRHKPAWVDLQIATLDAGVETTDESGSTSFQGHGAFAAHEGHVEIEMCRKLCEDGQLSDAVLALELLVQRGCHVPHNLFYRGLKRCIKDKDLVMGRRIHGLTVKSGHEGDAFLATHLIGLYASHGRLEEAMRVFTKIPTPDAYNWASIILAYARHREAAVATEAIRLYRQMCETTAVKPDDRIYSAVLKACATAGDVVAGKEVHSHTLASPGKRDRFVQVGLVNMYAKCRSLQDARRLFDKLADRDVATWTAMIAGYAQQGMGQEALNLYRSMQQEGLTRPNSVTYASLLQACASVGAGALDEGKGLHAEIRERGLEEDVVLGGSLVNMYAKCGSLEHARKLFDKLSDRDVVTWTGMIAAYAQQGMGQDALNLYRSMQQEGLTLPNSVTFLCLLQACATVGVGALDDGRQLHAKIKERRLQQDVVLGGSLVNMYAKCGALEEARKVFDELPGKNVVAWNVMLAGYAQQGMGQDALSLYRRMQHEGITSPDCVTYVCLLQACSSIGLGALDEGKQLHAQIIERGLQEDEVLAVSLVNMFAKCGSLQDARRLFDKLSEKSVVAWNAMIAGYAQQGMGLEALSLYRSMQLEGLAPPDCVTYACLLQACASVGVRALDEGKQLHAQIREQRLQEDAVLGSSLVNMYAKCGSLEDARSVFDKLPERNVAAWTALLAGCVQQGMDQEARSLYRSMQQECLTLPDSLTYVWLLKACASAGAGALGEGKELHATIKKRGLQNDIVLGGSLVNMYAKCGSLKEARRVFDELPERNVVAWTTILAGYAQEGLGQEALSLYGSMKQEGIALPDAVTYVCLLQACANVGVGALDEGKQLHTQIAEQGLQEDGVLGGSLVNMYAKCGSLEEARKVFDKLPERNVVAWTAMLAGYAQQGMGDEALNLYSRMQQEGLTAPDGVTYVCLLQACASEGVGALDKGRQLHAQIDEQRLQDDVVLGGSLVNMYAKCGSLVDARSVFDKLPEKNVVACNAMLAGYAQQGMVQEALCLYSSMQHKDVTSPNSITYICLLQACAAVAALPLGEQLHAEIEKRGMHADSVVGAALVNMYAKCGTMHDSQRVFDSLPQRSVEAWGALVNGYARQGDSDVVFSLLDRMRLEGIQPHGIIFLSVLTCCSHVGLVDKGREYFELMKTHFGISATLEHFICMVDLLGRAGHLDEALQMAKTMPFPPNAVMWRTLLGACWKWKNVEIGRQAFEGAISVDEKDAASYVLMSNIYASAQMWEAARELQAKRKKLGAWKKPGQSWWTDMCGLVHTFVVGDKEHPETEGIYARLEQLVPKMKKAGYVPHLQSSLLDLSDDEKEAELCGHSEKLAIAYALNNTADGTTIRIVKNLRVCEDCHTATGYISKVEKRTIICRDANRFHVFKGGKCSCGDYW